MLAMSYRQDDPAWVFSRWNAAQGRSRIAPLVAAWVQEPVAG